MKFLWDLVKFLAGLLAALVVIVIVVAGFVLSIPLFLGCLAVVFVVCLILGLICLIF